MHSGKEEEITYTLTRGIVADIKDPLKKFRIKIKMQDLGGAVWPEWVESGILSTFFSVPPLGSVVRVFRPSDHDCVDFSTEIFYLAERAGENFKIPKVLKSNYPNRQGFVAPSGAYMYADSSSGAEQLSLSDGKGSFVVMKDGMLSLGSENALSPFVLGDKLEVLLNTLLDAIATHVHPALGAPTATAPLFTALKATSVPQIKSTKIKGA